MFCRIYSSEAEGQEEKKTRNFEKMKHLRLIVFWCCILGVVTCVTDKEFHEFQVKCKETKNALCKSFDFPKDCVFNDGLKHKHIHIP